MEQNTDLTHLKRVRKSGMKTDEGVDVVDVILCGTSTLSEQEVQIFVDLGREKGIEITPRVVRVSRWPAYTKRQLTEFRPLWPVSLRKDSTRYSL
jgi:hypothetical protein